MPDHFYVVSGPQSFLNQNTGKLNQQSAASSQYYVATGEQEIVDVGEAYFDIVFPVQFLGKPNLVISGELSAGALLTKTQVPTLNGVVLTWDIETNEIGTTYYKGAYVSVVTTGTIGQVMRAVWMAMGLGLRNPVSGS